MRIIAVHRGLLTGLGIVLAVALGMYLLWLPSVIYSDYHARLDPLVRDLYVSFAQESSSLQRPVFNTPDVSPQVRQQDVERIARQNQALRAKLRRVAMVAGELQSPPPGIQLTGKYKKAAAMRAEAVAMTDQANDVLNAYDSLLAFLAVYDGLQPQLSSRLGTVNGLPDIDVLAGRQDELSAIAQQIAGYAQQLEAASVPGDFAPFKAEAVATFRQSSQAFDRLAYALQLNLDSVIYPSVQQIETLALKHEVNDQELLTRLSQQSFTLRQVDELPDKTERVAGG